MITPDPTDVLKYVVAFVREQLGTAINHLVADDNADAACEVMSQLHEELVHFLMPFSDADLVHTWPLYGDGPPVFAEIDMDIPNGYMRHWRLPAGFPLAPSAVAK